MTAPLLVALIGAALLAQLVIAVAVALWRRGQFGAVLRASQERPAPAGAKGAWEGWREFRVAQRQFEDAAQTQ